MQLTPWRKRDSCSVEQGFQKPQGYRGKGLEGRGQGIECLTPHKPLPLSKGMGIPLSRGKGIPSVFTGGWLEFWISSLESLGKTLINCMRFVYHCIISKVSWYLFTIYNAWAFIWTKPLSKPWYPPTPYIPLPLPFKTLDPVRATAKLDLTKI